MPSYDVAHIHTQGQDVIIVLVSGKPTDAQYAQLQACARSAGLAGRVVAIWRTGSTGMGYLGPQEWQSYCRSLSWDYFAANTNKRLTCG